MKFEEALAFWIDLEGPTPAGKEEEAKTCAVNNIFLHALNILAYSEMEDQLAELKRTAVEAGVVFSTKCGHAILKPEPADEPCYVCRAFSKAQEHEHDIECCVASCKRDDCPSLCHSRT